VKKLRQLRKEIAQIKTVAKERDLGIRGASKDTAKDVAAETAPAATGKKGAR
jgi:large subunit ribosomal protein L29